MLIFYVLCNVYRLSVDVIDPFSLQRPTFCFFCIGLSNQSFSALELIKEGESLSSQLWLRSECN